MERAQKNVGLKQFEKTLRSINIPNEGECINIRLSLFSSKCKSKNNDTDGQRNTNVELRASHRFHGNLLY